MAPHLAAILIFSAITTQIFSPVIFGRAVLRQNDIVNFEGMSKELKDYRTRNGSEALWTSRMFGGMPAFQISVDYRGNLLRHLDRLLARIFPPPAHLLFLAFGGFYILLLTLRTNPWLAMVGATSFALSSYNWIILADGHNSKLHAIALMPLVIAGILLLRQGNYRWGSLLTLASASLIISANHFQIAYYVVLMLLVYAGCEAFHALRQKSCRTLLVTGAAALLAGLFALLTNYSLVASTYEYAPSTIRGPSELTSTRSAGGLDRDYAFQWSYGKIETFTLLIPNLLGGSSHARLDSGSRLGSMLAQSGLPPARIRQYLNDVPLYWGEQPFTTGPVYAGAVVCLLFILALPAVKDRIRWWLLCVSLLAIVLAWGKNFPWLSDLFFRHFPAYNRFRSVSMILVLVQFCFPLLATLLLSGMLACDFDRRRLMRRLGAAVALTGGFCLLAALFGPWFLSFRGHSDALWGEQAFLEGLRADRAALMQADALRSLALILASGFVLRMFILGKIKNHWFIAGMGLLIFLDLYPVGKRCLPDDRFVSAGEYGAYFEPTAADRTILKDAARHFRVLNLAADTWNDARTPYHHESLGGYHAAKLRRYQEIIERQLSRGNSAANRNTPYNQAVVDMLNTRYVVAPGEEPGGQAAPNPGALGNAWFVDSVRFVADADEEMQALDSFNPATTALVDRRFGDRLQGRRPSHDPAASVQLMDYQPNRLSYSSIGSREGVIVFSDVYYQPGWKSYIDGSPVPHFRCNYILRGMAVPAGKHTIEFRFESDTFYGRERIAAASSALLIVLLAAIAAPELRRARMNG